MKKRDFDPVLLQSWMGEVSSWRSGGRVGRWIGRDEVRVKSWGPIEVWPPSVSPTVLFLSDCLRAGVMPQWVRAGYGGFRGLTHDGHICVMVKSEDGKLGWFWGWADGTMSIRDGNGVIQFPIHFCTENIQNVVLLGDTMADDPVVVES